MIYLDAVRFDNSGFQIRNLLLSVAFEFFRRIRRDQCIDHLADVTVQEAFKRVQRKTDSVIGNASLGIIVRSDAFASIARTNLTLSLRSNLFRLLGLLDVIQFRT